MVSVLLKAIQLARIRNLSNVPLTPKSMLLLEYGVSHLDYVCLRQGYIASVRTPVKLSLNSPAAYTPRES